MSSDFSVCVVDDDRPNLNMIRAMLETMNIKDIRCYSDAVHAWSDIQVTAPDFIISDWNMEPVSGIELLRQVRSDRSLCATPFVMVTANTSEDYWKQAIEAGVSEFLFKPLPLAMFRDTIYDVCAHLSISEASGYEQRVRGSSGCVDWRASERQMDPAASINFAPARCDKVIRHSFRRIRRGVLESNNH